MRICSYNVNGLRALHRKNGLNDLYAAITPDILCLQEVRCDGDASESIIHEIDSNMSGIINSNIHNVGYAGVGIMYNSLRYSYGSIPINNLMNFDESDYFSGRLLLIPITENVVIVNVYTLNSGDKDALRQRWDALFYDLITKLIANYKLIICGDLNTVLDENDHWKGLSNVVNQGPGLMEYEHQGLVKLLNLGFIDSYKCLHPRGEKKSWFSYRGGAYYKHKGWRLDYILVDKRLQNKIISADIYEDFCGSDHRPIVLDINL